MPMTDNPTSTPLGTQEGWLPKAAFWIAWLWVSGICGSLGAHWWHYVIGFLAVCLVRVTSRYGRL